MRRSPCKKFPKGKLFKNSIQCRVAPLVWWKALGCTRVVHQSPEHIVQTVTQHTIGFNFFNLRNKVTEVFDSLRIALVL
eukprot:552538-Amphidinium_carterae.1